MKVIKYILRRNLIQFLHREELRGKMHFLRKPTSWKPQTRPIHINKEQFNILVNSPCQFEIPRELSQICLHLGVGQKYATFNTVEVKTWVSGWSKKFKNVNVICESSPLNLGGPRNIIGTVHPKY